MSAASATSKSTDDSDATTRIVELISRVEEAKKAQLCLSPEDCDLLVNAVLTLANMQERLSHNDLTIVKLKKLLGIVRSSEKTNDLFPDTHKDTAEQAGEQASTDDKSTDDKDNKRDSRDTRSGQKDPGKSRKPPKPKPPITHKHALEGLSKGDPCPQCPDGKLYKYTPAVLIRIVGNEPLSSERHLSEQLRCGNCGDIITASLPAHVKADGRPGQQVRLLGPSTVGAVSLLCRTALPSSANGA